LILARLHDFPRSRDWLYKTWEVKVSLLCKDGSARSLKSGQGKIDRLTKQMRAYRDFGSPDVSLLDVCICEPGSLAQNAFPPVSLRTTISTKQALLSKDNFGYQLLPFELDGQGCVDDLRSYAPTMFNIIRACPSQPHEPFSGWANRISEFFEKTQRREIFYIWADWIRDLFKHTPCRPRNQPRHIVFCRDCQRLQLIDMRETHTCPTCQSDFVTQS
jgi:hypothetical protein